MNREEIKAEIVRLISEHIDGFTGGSEEKAAEEVLVFLEDIGFDSEMSAFERERKVAVYAANDPNASWNNPK